MVRELTITIPEMRLAVSLAVELYIKMFRFTCKREIEIFLVVQVSKMMLA